jgi:hypothetical protein
MKAAELVACRVLEDPAFPMPVEGYMVSFVAFYEWRFGMSSHWFLRSLLQHYGLELHNLTPSRVLHMAAFATLCEAYLGIDPQFDLWNYFFCVRCLQDLDAGLMVSGGAVIHVKSGHGLDPYFNIPMPRSMKGWQKKWFYMRNTDSAPLPTISGCAPFPYHLGGRGWLGRILVSCSSCVRPFNSYDRMG